MAFITNVQSPVDYDELVERYECDMATCIEIVLNGNSSFGEWTVDKDSVRGDIAFFVCAETSPEHMDRICDEAKRRDNSRIASFAERERVLYKSYAGRIMAIGKVASAPIKGEPDSGHAHWENPWHAEIRDFRLLSDPISMDSLHGFIETCQTEPTTKLNMEQTCKLLELVVFGNPE